MSTRTSRLLLINSSFALMFAVTSAVQADDGPQDAASTIVPENDPQYALLGEFVGPVLVGKNKYQPFALQIRPVGGENFEALQYRGGLPGQKTHKPEAIQLIGRRYGDFVVMSGGPWAIFVETDHCLLVDREGKQAGRLERVIRQSPTLGAQPPKNAVVLFDGTNTDHFTNGQMTADGLLMEGADLKPMFQDFNLHVEFRLPYMPAATGQARGNSGLYLQSRYELQVLDSFAEEPTINGIGSLYQTRKPDVNMCLPPLQWQTYDVAFTAPRWVADGSKLRNARMTAWLNGVKVQNDVELLNKTGAGQEEAPTLLPIRLQNHKDPVRFRNIWLVDRGLAPVGRFPVYPSADEAKKESEQPEATPEKAPEEKDAAEAKPPAEEKPPAAEDADKPEEATSDL